MTDHAEFGSHSWFLALKSMLEEKLAGVDLTGIDFCFSEEYTDPPEHLCGRGQSSIGWHMAVRDGALHIKAHPTEADVRVVGDYSMMHTLAKTVFTDDPEVIATMTALVEDAKAKGKFLQFEKPETARPPQLDVLRALHNELAQITI